MSRLRIVFSFLALWFAASAVQVGAQQYEVLSYIRPERGVTTQSIVRYVIEVRGTLRDSPRYTPPVLTGIVNLSVLAGPTVETSFALINGRQSSTFRLVYAMAPASAGTAVIPASTIELNGKSYPIREIRFEVREQARSDVPADGFDVHLRAELDQKSVWVGETTLLTVSIFNRERRTLLPQLLSPRPDFADLVAEIQRIDSQSEAYRADWGGRPFQVYPLERAIITAPTAGTYEIEPYGARLTMRGRGFFDQGTQVYRQSKPLRLEARPLPSGAPDDFSGSVGRFDLGVTLDRSDARVNDAVSLKAVVSGEGSLRSARPPSLDLPSTLKVYDPEVTTGRAVKGGTLVSTKTWEWLVVPLAPGDVSVPETAFSYFDVQSEQYRRATSEPLRLAVAEGDPFDVASGRPGAGLTIQNRDLAYIKRLEGNLVRAHARAHESPLFVSFIAAPFLLAPALIWLGRRRERLSRDHGRVRSRRALSRARKRLRAARQHFDDDDSSGFHEALARTLVEYVADRFNRSAAGLTYEVADELLAANDVDEALRRRFRSCLEACDFARFVPASGQPERRKEALDESIAVVGSLEKAL